MALARKSAVFLIMFVAVIMVSSCAGADVEPGSQISSSGSDFLPSSPASPVVSQAAPKPCQRHGEALHFAQHLLVDLVKGG